MVAAKRPEPWTSGAPLPGSAPPLGGARRTPQDEDFALGISMYDQDEDLLERVRSTGRAEVRVVPWVGPVTLVLGRGSRVAWEADLESCRADGVPLLRRRGGGCAVVLDPGNVILSAVIPSLDLGSIRNRFTRLSEWVLGGLARIGLPEARRLDVSDLCLGDLKIGGASLYFGRGVAYYSTTLLHSPVVASWARYLPHPPREPGYRQGRAHADFVACLEPRWGGTPAGLAMRLAAALGPTPDFA